MKMRVEVFDSEISATEFDTLLVRRVSGTILMNVKVIIKNNIVLALLIL